MPCITCDSAHVTTCNCVLTFYGDKGTTTTGKLLIELYNYEVAPDTTRNVYVHGIVSKEDICGKNLPRGKRMSPRYLVPYLESRICKNAIRILFCIGRQVWVTVSSVGSPPKTR